MESKALTKKHYLPNYLFGPSPNEQVKKIYPKLHNTLNPANRNDKDLTDCSQINFSNPKSNKTIKFAPETFERKTSYLKTPPSSYFLKNKPPIRELKDDIYSESVSNLDFTPILNNSDFDDIQENLSNQNPNIADILIQDQIVYNPEDYQNSNTFKKSDYSQFKGNSIFNSQNSNLNQTFENKNIFPTCFDSLTEYWVRVFGYPNTYTNNIISSFSEYGDILDYKFATECGNWIDLKYQTKLQATQALRQNSRILVIDGNQIMIGVTPAPNECVNNVNGNWANPSTQPSSRRNIRDLINRSTRNKTKLALRQSIDKRKVTVQKIITVHSGLAVRFELLYRTARR
ncbi:nucleoporin NUP35-like isoform X2 [Gordionus sp. m RMFG-2023]|uniref:nucleoporin NUP35-like isoform X2 n=1 Tax=Gordionus sp. m RMFG-2023 TaxID=3053472 RepID=UPI0031FDB7C5